MAKERELEALAREFSHTLPDSFLTAVGGAPSGLKAFSDDSRVIFRLGGLDYACEFDLDEYGQVHFNLKASSDGKAVKLGDTRMVSNTTVDNTHYLSNRRLSELDDGSVFVTCRIKRRVPSADSRKALYADIVRYVVREVASTSRVSG